MSLRLSLSLKMNTNINQQLVKSLNIEKWSTDLVCEWLKGNFNNMVKSYWNVNSNVEPTLLENIYFIFFWSTEEKLVILLDLTHVSNNPHNNHILTLIVLTKKGIRTCTDIYMDNFKENEINGKKLILIEMSDLSSLLETSLNNQIIVFKAIQNLIRFVSFFLIENFWAYFKNTQ